MKTLSFQMNRIFNLHIIGIMGIIIGIVLSSSCDKKHIETTENNNSYAIKYLKIPLIYNIKKGEPFKLSGVGFKIADELVLDPGANNGNLIALPIQLENDSLVSVSTINSDFSGRYTISLRRNNKTSYLGSTYVNTVFDNTIPDKTGMPVKGTVYSQGKGVADVVVSDGYEITKTDQNGVYYLPSKKQNGYVFISVPENYEVAKLNTLPQFYKSLAGLTAESEIRDFELFPKTNNDYVLIAMADMHLANRNSDLAQFQEGFIKDVQSLEAAYRAQGKQVYGLTLGDQTWDAYWYTNNFIFPQYIDQIKALNFPIYNTIGNHDNDPYFSNDFLAERKYISSLGPTYYSFNLGKVHYVVLDNMIQVNNGAKEGMIGDREFISRITQNQLAWLSKDLATVTDKSTPIVLAMHVPLHSTPILSNYTVRLENGNELKAALADFNQVKILTGHTHVNYRIEPPNEAIAEHNIAAVCATWWWTGRSDYTGVQVSRDGSPGGYQVYEVNNKEISWYYKSIGYERNYQFRAYDLNKVLITSSLTPNADNTYKSKVASYAGEYAKANANNEILINIWGYQPNWKISVTEEGKSLPVTQVNKLDPLHILAYSLQRLNVNADPTPTFVTVNTSHLFLVKAEQAKTTVEIKVEDSFGHVYTEKMIRPKDFKANMK